MVAGQAAARSGLLPRVTPYEVCSQRGDENVVEGKNVLFLPLSFFSSIGKGIARYIISALPSRQIVDETVRAGVREFRVAFFPKSFLFFPPLIFWCSGAQLRKTRREEISFKRRIL